MARADVARIAIALLTALAVVITAHVAAPIAHAECDGQVPYAGTIGLAHGAIVGVVSKVGQDEHAFVFASEVAVERAVGLDAGPL